MDSQQRRRRFVFLMDFRAFVGAARMRFAFLDGIRGLAAIVVLIRHTAFFPGDPLFRSYLAVDIFFLLSGFVIGNAYDEKLRSGTLSAWDFALIRIIRLYPVYFLSVVICALQLWVKGSVTGEPLEGAGLLMPLAAAVFLPWKIPSSPLLFPLNVAYWSLFFELVANFTYAVARPALTDRVLILVVAAASLLVAVCAFEEGTLVGGFEWGGLQILTGLSRSFFGIFLGLLIYRKRKLLGRIFDGFDAPWLAVLAIVVASVSPSAGRLDSLVDLACVFVLFPLCVIVAAKGVSRYEGMLLYLGSASYPMYVLHKPLGAFVYFAAMRAGVPESLYLGVGVAFIAFVTVLSVWLERVYDVPVRRALTDMRRSYFPAAGGMPLKSGKQVMPDGANSA